VVASASARELQCLQISAKLNSKKDLALLPTRELGSRSHAGAWERVVRKSCPFEISRSTGGIVLLAWPLGEGIGGAVTRWCPCDLRQSGIRLFALRGHETAQDHPHQTEEDDS
jgi:hypothetical protein